MKKLLDNVRALTEEELQDANKKFPMFSSDHEGSAVMLEEIEEVKDALQGVEAFYAELWDSVKNNRELEARVSAGGLKGEALDLAAEAVQVAAMAQKFIDSQDIRDEEVRDH